MESKPAEFSDPRIADSFRPLPRGFWVFALDLAVASAAWVLAFFLRYNFEVPEPMVGVIRQTLIVAVICHGAVFWGFGLHRGMWRYVSLPDLKRLVLASIAAVALSSIALIGMRLAADVPRSVWLMDGLLLVVLLGGARIAYRVYREGVFSVESGEPVIVLGAGSASLSLLRELARNGQWTVVGLLDDDKARWGRVIYRTRVLGGIDALPYWASKIGVKKVILAMPSATYVQRRRATELCQTAGVQALTVPALADIISGKLQISQLQNVEVEDLLGRAPVVLTLSGLQELLDGRVVLVTGAGGSIGAELCRQIARFSPSKMLLVDVSEPALYHIEEELGSGFGYISERKPIRTIPLIGDVKDPERIEEIFSTHQPDVVFHAAAYKHVPLMEGSNAWQALQNNVFGTYVIGQASIRHKVKKVVLISTDKAVRPANVMGASKRLAEMVCQSLNSVSPTKFVIVRFGNVLGSNGSVIPKFKEQIRRGGPVTVTHPQMTRFFMSIPEASQLVLQSAYMGQGGEIFVLDMGNPVRILDLAKDMIRLSGLAEGEIDIVFSGFRPGEKLEEELFGEDESAVATNHPKVRKVQLNERSFPWIEEFLGLRTQTEIPTREEVGGLLRRWIPDCVVTGSESSQKDRSQFSPAPSIH
jgi:FlaA1/EpsC-like NDP-sugar epimerase